MKAATPSRSGYLVPGAALYSHCTSYPRTSVWYDLVWSNSVRSDPDRWITRTYARACAMQRRMVHNNRSDARIDKGWNWVKMAPSGTVSDYLAHVTRARVSCNARRVFPVSECSLAIDVRELLLSCGVRDARGSCVVEEATKRFDYPGR